MISLSHYLILAAILFAISIVGIFLNRKNLIVLLMAIELMLLAVNLNFVAFSHYLNDLSGQLFVFFILVVAAAESASASPSWWCCSATCPRSMSKTSTAEGLEGTWA
jgi:NADH-quinone oxidoreductase subunit K